MFLNSESRKPLCLLYCVVKKLNILKTADKDLKKNSHYGFIIPRPQQTSWDKYIVNIYFSLQYWELQIKSLCIPLNIYIPLLVNKLKDMSSHSQCSQTIRIVTSIRTIDVFFLSKTKLSLLQSPVLHIDILSYILFFMIRHIHTHLLFNGQVKRYS